MLKNCWVLNPHHVTFPFTLCHVQVQLRQYFIIFICSYLSPSSAILSAKTDEAPDREENTCKQDGRVKKVSSSSWWLLRQQALVESGSACLPVAHKLLCTLREGAYLLITTRQLAPKLFQAKTHYTPQEKKRKSGCVWYRAGSWYLLLFCTFFQTCYHFHLYNESCKVASAGTPSAANRSDKVLHKKGSGII